MVTDSDIRKEISGKDILLFLIPNRNYSDGMKSITAASAKIFDKICYVSLNKPHETLMSIFKGCGINTGGIVFVDCVAAGAKKPASVCKVFFVPSPNALTDLNIAINNVVKEERAKVILFDSLSTILVYQEPSIVIKFSHSIISSLRSAKVKGVFTCLKEDIGNELVKDLSMFVDKIVEL